MKFKFFVDNELVFDCKIDSERCSGYNKNGSRCKRRVCLATPYCFTHMPEYLHLKVKQSTIANAGKGLFAFDKNKGNNEIIFKKGDLICKYGGEFISHEELDDRYGDYTAPYGMHLTNQTVQDCACKRDVGSLANSANLKKNNNAEFYVSTAPIREVKLRAIKNIYNNQEILINYGNDYIMHEQGAYHTTK
jgi:hypothetical protein